MRHFWEAAIAVDPSARDFDAGTQFAICNPDNLRALFAATGFTDIDVIPLDIQTQFANFDDFWLPFLAAQGSISKYFRALNDDQRHRIRQQLLRQLPINDDQTIHLSARAWAVQGRR